MTDTQSASNTLPDLFLQLVTLDLPAAVAHLEAAGLASLETATHLANVALEKAETEPQSAAHWLTVAQMLNTEMDADANDTVQDISLAAQIAYAQARLQLMAGDLRAAETRVREAQAHWQTAGDEASLTRSYHGLTQILTLQGRYDEAEKSIRTAIEQHQIIVATDPSMIPALLGAFRNLANLLRYQDQHEAALTTFQQARQILTQHLSKEGSTPQASTDATIILYEQACLDAIEAITLMHLDQPTAAEQCLRRAIAYFDQTEDWLNRGRANSNLGSLHLRTGRYAQALKAFEKASTDLLGDSTIGQEPSLERLRQADVTPLDQAMTYLALNLLAEATTALKQCEQLFRGAERLYELGQSLYTLGLVSLKSGDVTLALTWLKEAEQHFTTLDNRYWLNHTQLALAKVAYEHGDSAEAITRLETILAQLSGQESVESWDSSTIAELRLLSLRIHLDNDEIAEANQQAKSIARLLGLEEAVELKEEESVEELPLHSHLHLRLYHALGQIEAKLGHREKAHQYFLRAIKLLESQRASLPLEEIRTAFLDDKTNIYTDLILNLLDTPEPTSDTLADAFEMVERARSRALLERLLASVTEDDSSDDMDILAARREEIRKQLHWLYNQLLGEEGSRGLEGELSQEIQAYESTLQQLEWQSSPLLTQAQPVDLDTLQGALQTDQKIVIYYIANEEVLAFVVAHKTVHIVRRLCTTAEVVQAHTELRFQLGRAELGSAYLQRHAARLQRALQSALHRLYQLLVEPLVSQLDTPRVQIIPHGLLHRIPFHALWNGEGYLLEQFECSYAPSASITVLCLERSQAAAQPTSIAGLAITDLTIPQARPEVESIANHFEQSWLYLDERASRSGLQEAAAQADVLHIATHGLFRADNPFFSSLKLADGWMDVRDIYRLNLHAQLVVLSACESGTGQVQGGDEVIGLARGFLGAGATSLMASQWNVHDASAAMLMNHFYQHFVTAPQPNRPTAALRTAQLAAIKSQQHPYFWAPFFVIG